MAARSKFNKSPCAGGTRELSLVENQRQFPSLFRCEARACARAHSHSPTPARTSRQAGRTRSSFSRAFPKVGEKPAFFPPESSVCKTGEGRQKMLQSEQLWEPGLKPGLPKTGSPAAAAASQPPPFSAFLPTTASRPRFIFLIRSEISLEGVQ